MAYKMFQEFPTTSSDITFICQHFCLIKHSTRVKTELKTKTETATQHRLSLCADRGQPANHVTPSELHTDSGGGGGGGGGGGESCI